MPPWEVQGGLLLGIAAVLTALGGLGKLLYDVAAMRRQQAATTAQLRPNGGGSLRDAINRLEDGVSGLTTGQEALSTDVARLREAGRRHDRELERVNNATARLEGTMGQMGERLALADSEDRRHADLEHQRLQAEIDRLKGPLS